MRYRVFENFEAFVESIQGIESRMMMLRNPTYRRWTIKSIELGEIEVQIGRLGSGNIAQGQMRSDGLLLYLPLMNEVEYVACGTVMEKGTAAVCEPGCEFCIRTITDHDWCSIFVPNHIIAGPPTDDGGQTDQVLGQKRCWVTMPNLAMADWLRSASRELIANASAHPTFEHSPAAKQAAEDVFKIVSGFVRELRIESVAHEGRPILSRKEIVQNAMAFLERRTGTSVRVAELAAAADVSERTLRNAFGEFFGVGPVRYLQLRQLHRIHRVLLQADPDEVTVGQVLADQCEWAFSRFAARYRKHFGERPSETLRSRPS
jgi:AraC-like DNA-binding protein